MAKNITSAEITREEVIRDMIYIIRGYKVMLDSDLAALYGVPTGRLNEQAKRNSKRFPEDFMFLLTKQEFENLKSQFAISSWGGRRKLPYVFTEQGVAMLSSVLSSDRAIQVNIAIMRTFTKLREIMATHKELRQKIEEIEKKYDGQFQVVFTAIKELFGKFNEPEKPKGKIGFHPNP